MDVVQLEDMSKFRREKSREAIVLALQGKWERATEVNRGILELFADDVEAKNRLGKAFLELGRYPEARAAFEGAAKLAPYNTISKKNLERLSHLEENASPPKPGRVVTPYHLIAESGKSGITVLQKLASPEVLAKMAAGDEVALVPRDHTLVVEKAQGEVLGQIESKLAMRLMRLIKDGNRYDSAIINVNHQEIVVIIWETYRNPDIGNACLFPTRSKDDHKAFWKDAILRYDIESETEDDEEYSSDRREAPDGGTSDGDEASDSLYPVRVGSAARDEDDEDD